MGTCRERCVSLYPRAPLAAPREDGQREDCRKCMALVLRWEYAGVPGPEIGEQEQGVV
jgi:hypothetical protein